MDFIHSNKSNSLVKVRKKSGNMVRTTVPTIFYNKFLLASIPTTLFLAILSIILILIISKTDSNDDKKIWTINTIIILLIISSLFLLFVIVLVANNIHRKVDKESAIDEEVEEVVVFGGNGLLQLDLNQLSNLYHNCPNAISSSLLSPIFESPPAYEVAINCDTSSSFSDEPPNYNTITKSDFDIESQFDSYFSNNLCELYNCEDQYNSRYCNCYECNHIFLISKRFC
jgi:hypothetical protein